MTRDHGRHRRGELLAAFPGEMNAARVMQSRRFCGVAQYGGQYLVVGGPMDSVEGNWRLAFPVLIEQAHWWYNSEEYRAQGTAAGRYERSRCFHGWRGDLGQS